MGILSWIIVGLIAGWLAGLVMRSRLGILGDLIIGLLGGLVGGFLATLIFGIADPVNGINLYSIIISFMGAVLLIAVIRALPGRSPV
jgi:uncharacterized membrane protein YeaQ/YmgE (transglycosylase-associated protein family)